MTLASKITLIRVAFIPVYMVLMYLSGGCPNYWMWIALGVFILASLTDFVDGQIARRCNQVSDFGKFLDPVADKLLNMSALIMLSHQGLLPAWVAVVILARELCVDGLRMVAVGQGRVIAAGKLGKIKTVSQIVLVVWLMISLQPVTHAVSLVLTAWVVIITLWSGVDYLVRNKDCIKNA